MEVRYVLIGLLCLLVLQGCGPVVSPPQGDNRNGDDHSGGGHR